MTDVNGNVRWRATYEAFGKLESEAVWEAENNVRFPGQYHDRATELYYNMFRHYRPDLGRYLTPDPIGLAGGINLYGYAGQNPVNNIDPWGLERYKFHISAGIGIVFTYGHDEGKSYLEGGFILSAPSIGFQIQTPGQIPEQLEFDEGERGAIAVGYYTYEGLGVGIPKTPVGETCGTFEYTGLAAALTEDYDLRGLGRTDDTAFPNGSPYVHYKGESKQVSFSFPFKGGWLEYITLWEGTLGFSW